MFSETLQVKRFFGIKFGYGEPLQDGVYAVPTNISKGKAFMRMEVVNGGVAGDKNFYLFWDEKLTRSWYNTQKPLIRRESKFAKLFRKIEECR